MRLDESQREMRESYVGGSVGGFVPGGLWLASATLATWSSRNQAVWALILVLTGAVLAALHARETGGRGSTDRNPGHRMPGRAAGFLEPPA